MSGPWEDYQSGPWDEYAAPPVAKPKPPAPPPAPKAAPKAPGILSDAAKGGGIGFLQGLVGIAEQKLENYGPTALLNQAADTADQLVALYRAATSPPAPPAPKPPPPAPTGYLFGLSTYGTPNRYLNEIDSALDRSGQGKFFDPILSAQAPDSVPGRYGAAVGRMLPYAAIGPEAVAPTVLSGLAGQGGRDIAKAAGGGERAQSFAEGLGQLAGGAPEAIKALRPKATVAADGAPLPQEPLRLPAPEPTRALPAPEVAPEQARLAAPEPMRALPAPEPAVAPEPPAVRAAPPEVPAVRPSPAEPVVVAANGEPMAARPPEAPLPVEAVRPVEPAPPVADPARPVDVAPEAQPRPLPQEAAVPAAAEPPARLVAPEPPASRVLIDQGVPVKVVAEGEGGRVTVQRADPATGAVDPQAVPYDTHLAWLSQSEVPAAPEPVAPELPAAPAGLDAPPVAAPEAVAPAPLPEQAIPPAPVAPPEALTPAPEALTAPDLAPEAVTPAPIAEAPKPSSPSALAPTEGRFAVDEANLVVSDKGGPVRFGDQRQAAKWVMNVGQKEAPGQTFEIANHPQGGFTVRATDAAPLPEMVGKAPGGETVVSPPGRPAPEAAGGVGPAVETTSDVTGPAGAFTTKPSEAEGKVPNAQGGPSGDAEVIADSRAPQDPTLADEPAPHDPLRDGPSPEPAGPTTLYSGVDPEAVSELFGKPIKKAVDDALAKTRKNAAWQKEALNGTSLSPLKVVDQVRDVLREANISIAGALQHFARKYEAVPAVRQMSDMLASEPGAGRATVEPLEYAIRRTSQEAHTRASNILSDWEKAMPDVKGRAFSDKVRRLMTGEKPSPGDAPYVQRLRKALDDWRKHLTDAGLEVGDVKDYFPRNPDPVRVDANQKGFVDAARKVYEAEGVADPNAQANAWLNEILTGGDLHVQRSPNGTLSTRSTRERVFTTKAADRFLTPFFQDARGTLADYFMRTAKQAEFARRFGADGSKADAMFQQMLGQGVSPKDLNYIRRAFDTVTGMTASTKPSDLATLAGWVNTIYTMRLLSRSLSAQLTEPWVAAIRSGDMRVGMKGVGEYLFAPFSSETRGAWRDRAELMGVLGDIHTDAMLMSRAGASDLGRTTQVALNNFFRNTGVAQITEFQITSATKIADWRLRGLLRQLDKPNNAPALRALADEFGLSETQARGIADWGKSFGDLPPPVKDMVGKGGEPYRQALYRWVNETVQNPTVVDSPLAAADPRFKAAYGITRFLNTFTRKVLIKAIRDTGGAALGKNGFEKFTPMQRAMTAMGTLVAYGVYTWANAKVWDARQSIFNPQLKDELNRNQRAYNTVAQSQVLGTLQPAIDLGLMAAGRYQRDLTSAYAGPRFTTAADDLMKLAKGIEGGSKKTNNAEWGGARAGYNLASNVALFGLNLVPAGGLARLPIFAAEQVIAAPGTSRAVADATVGERTVKPHGDKKRPAVDNGTSPQSTGDDFGGFDKQFSDFDKEFR